MRNDADNGVDDDGIDDIKLTNSDESGDFLCKICLVFLRQMYDCMLLYFLQHYFFTRKETKTSTRILLRSAMIKFLVQGCLVLNNFCFIKHKAAKLHLFFNDDKHFVDRYDS